jgi:hypothetical protein
LLNLDGFITLYYLNSKLFISSIPITYFSNNFRFKSPTDSLPSTHLKLKSPLDPHRFH